MLDQLRFDSCNLLVTRRRVKEISFHCLRPLMPSKCYLSKGTARGQGFIAKIRTGSGNDYRSSSPMRGTGPENPLVTIGT